MPGSDQPEEVSPFPVGRLTLDTTPIDGNRQTPLTPPVRRAKMPQDRSGEGGKGDNDVQESRTQPDRVA